MNDCYRPLIVALCRDRVAHDRQHALHARLLERLRLYSGVTVRELPHLYDLEPYGPAMNYLRAVEGDLLVAAWMYPRAIQWVLAAHGINGRVGQTQFFPAEEMADSDQAATTNSNGRRTLWLIDLRPHHDPLPLLGEIERIVVARGGPPMPHDSAPISVAPAEERIDEPTRPRWYPVVDYSRCQTCMECLNFCLFGVFGLDGQSRILVEQPDACRNGCPACARVCPSQAIMFPEHHNPSIAGELRGPAADLNVDLMQLFGSFPAAELAGRERAKFVAEAAGSKEGQSVSAPPARETQQANHATSGPGERDELDELVDKLDQDGLDS